MSGKRVRFSFCGTSDIAQFDPNAANPLAVVSMHQQVWFFSIRQDFHYEFFVFPHHSLTIFMGLFLQKKTQCKSGLKLLLQRVYS